MFLTLLFSQDSSYGFCPVFHSYGILLFVTNEFIGRKEYLIDLHNKIKNKNNRIIQIDGLGGIGKTAFVHYYCRVLCDKENKEYLSDFDFIIWTSAKRNKYTPRGIKELNQYISDFSDLVNDIYTFIESNRLISLDFEDHSPVEVVKSFLALNKALLIVDNLETLNDEDLISFLGDFPSKSKAILTTRETLADFFMARISLSGFKLEQEFPDFLESQYQLFSGGYSFKNKYGEYYRELHKYTKGMPLAGQLLTHQLSLGIPISIVLQNLKSGKAYNDILTFCFKGSIERLSDVEKDVMFIFSLPEKEDLLTLEDLKHISGYSSDEIGLEAIPKLRKISLCFEKANTSGEVGYSIPHLAKIFLRQNSDLSIRKNELTEKFEDFVNEKYLIDDIGMSNEELFRSTKAKTHQEKIAITEAFRAQTISFNNYDEAIKIIEDLIRKNPDFSYLRLIKGKIENQSYLADAYNIAKRDFQIALDLDEENIEALIELGYLEQKRRSLKRDRYISLVKSSVRYFKKALSIEPLNQRANLGCAMGLMSLAKNKNPRYDKMERINLGRTSNEHFEKAYYLENISNLSKTQKHLNAIVSYNYALNNKIIFRDFDKVISLCKKGLEYEPNNEKLKKLLEDITEKKNPKSWSDTFKDKGWTIR